VSDSGSLSLREQEQNIQTGPRSPTNIGTELLRSYWTHAVPRGAARHVASFSPHTAYDNVRLEDAMQQFDKTTQTHTIPSANYVGLLLSETVVDISCIASFPIPIRKISHVAVLHEY